MAIEQDKRRPAWLLPLLLLLGLLLVGLILFAFLRGDDDPDSDTALTGPLATAAPLDSPTVSAPAQVTPAPATAAPTAAASAAPSTTPAGGSSTPARVADSPLLAAGQPLLPLAQPDQDLTGRAGQPAEADGVVVQSVDADEGFWVGSSAQNRVWVQFAQTATETDLAIEEGQQLSFQQAVVVAHDDDYAAATGVSAAEGAAQLSAQGAHVEVPREAVTIVDRP